MSKFLILEKLSLDDLLAEVNYRAEGWQRCAVGEKIHMTTNKHPRDALNQLGFSQEEANDLIAKGMRFTHLAEELYYLYREIQRMRPKAYGEDVSDLKIVKVKQ